jgi:hypothetical protein
MGRHKRDKTYMGHVEHSFCLGTDKTRTRVYRLSEAPDTPIKKYIQWYQDSVKSASKSYPEWTWKLYRVGSKNCPVKIDWGGWHDELKDIGKFNWRNLKYTAKDYHGCN